LSYRTEAEREERQERIEKSKTTVEDDEFPTPKEALETYRRTGTPEMTSAVIVEDTVVSVPGARYSVPAGTVVMGGAMPVEEYWTAPPPHDRVALLGRGDEVLAAYHPKVTTASEGVAVVGEVTVLVGDVDRTQGVPV